jgi:hypothetical protein
MSSDSIYISQNVSWQEADTNQLSGSYGKDVSVCTVDVVKIDKNIFFHVSASALKQSDDSIHFFIPPENGGTVVVGKLINKIIYSGAKGFNGSKITWITNSSFEMNNTTYIRLYKVRMNWFKEVLNKYTYSRGKDSLVIILAGP